VLVRIRTRAGRLKREKGVNSMSDPVSVKNAGLLTAKGIVLPTQWNGSWFKKRRTAFFKMAMKWDSVAVAEHNHSLGSVALSSMQQTDGEETKEQRRTKLQTEARAALRAKRNLDPVLEAADKEKHRLEEMQRRISKKLQAAPVEELDEDELEWLMDSTDITSSRFGELSGELMRKRLRADHEEWEQERKNSYALSGQLPPDSHSDEEAQDDLAPIIGAYLQHQHSLLCGVELEPLAESDQDQLESAATKAIEKEHSMMMANDDRANSYTHYTKRSHDGITWLHYRVDYWASARRAGCELEPTSLTSTEWARKAATKELRRQEELQKRLEHRQALQRQRAEQLAAEEEQEHIQAQARIEAERAAKPRREAAINDAHVGGFDMLKCTHEGCINMTVHNFHSHVSATKERWRKDSALQKKEKRKNMCKKTKSVRASCVPRKQLACKASRLTNLQEGIKTIHNYYAWMKSISRGDIQTPSCGHTLEALKSAFDSHPHLNSYDPTTDELKWH